MEGTRHPRKIVSIPVVFAGSEEEEEVGQRPHRRVELGEAEAAVRIQKVARGFLARNNARVVRRVEAELDRLERSAEQLLRTTRPPESEEEKKERMRVGEAVMGLLLELDSVRGVRDYRRRVARRAVALQDAVDAALTSSSSSSSQGALSEESIDGESAAVEGDRSDGADRMEAMAEENRALRKVVEELRESNEMQLTMMRGLLERIGRLEGAVGRHVLARRRKRPSCGDSRRSRSRKCDGLMY